MYFAVNGQPQVICPHELAMVYENWEVVSILTGMYIIPCKLKVCNIFKSSSEPWQCNCGFNNIKTLCRCFALSIRDKETFSLPLGYQVIMRTNKMLIYTVQAGVYKFWQNFYIRHIVYMAYCCTLGFSLIPSKRKSPDKQIITVQLIIQLF